MAPLEILIWDDFELVSALDGGEEFYCALEDLRRCLLLLQNDAPIGPQQCAPFRFGF